MTADDARNYFFQQLPQVRNTSDLLRLTLWVLPYLPAAPDRPLGSMETMDFRLKLEKSEYSEKTRVWFSSNRDVSNQLKMLTPVYEHISSGPHFCSGAYSYKTIPNGPSFAGPGLSLGVFAKEHEAARKKLDAASTVKSWWTIFLGQTPLWMRTAYNWPKPNAEQNVVLMRAKKEMVAYASIMAKHTRVEYDNRRNNHSVSIRLAPTFSQGVRQYADALHWTALVAGQRIIDILKTQEHCLEIRGLQEAMPGVQASIGTLCQVTCALRGWNEMGDLIVDKAVEDERKRSIAMRASKMDIDISYLDEPLSP